MPVTESYRHVPVRRLQHPRGALAGYHGRLADEAGRDAYLPHPLHQAVVAKLLPMLDGGLDEVVAFDFIDGVMG